MKISVVVFGAAGRLGASIVRAIEEDSKFSLISGVTRENRSQLWGAVKRANVAIDATRANSISENLSWARMHKIPYILAVTGYGNSTETKLKRASKTIPILIATNFSRCANVTQELLRKAARFLPAADVEIVETHQRSKLDAPSGTAKIFAAAILQGREKGKIVFEPKRTGRRSSRDIVVHSLRGGDVVKDHKIYFLDEGEMISIAHTVTSPIVYARGALEAARFLVKKRSGLYSMDDVLGKKQSS